MTFYIVFEMLLIVFALLAWARNGDWRIVLPFRLIIWAVIIFRYQTGYDWPAYTDHFEGIASAPSLATGEFEVGFQAFVWLVAQITDNVEILFWAVSIAVLSAVWFFERLVPARWVGVLYLVVVNFLIFSIFFSVLRQSLAWALCLVGLVILAGNHRDWRGYAALLAAPFFQITSVMYVAIVLAGLVPMRTIWFWTTAIVGAALVRAAWFAVPHLPKNSLTEQATFYVRYSQEAPSLEMLFLIVLCSFCLGAIAWLHRRKSLDVITRAAIFSALAVLVFVDVTILRNRILYLMVPLVIVAMIRAPHPRRLYQGAAVVALSMLSAFYYGAWFLRQTAVAIVPYQNYLASRATGCPSSDDLAQFGALNRGALASSVG